MAINSNTIINISPTGLFFLGFSLGVVSPPAGASVVPSTAGAASDVGSPAAGASVS